MTDEEVVEWIDKRQEFRAHFLEIAQLPKVNSYMDRTQSVLSYAESEDD